MPECLKCKDKRKQGGKSESANFVINDLHLVEKKDLGKRKVGRMLIASEDTSGKKLLLDYDAMAHIFDEQHYFTSYIYVQTADQYITIGSHNHIFIAGHGSVKFQAKLLDGILTVVLHNIIHVPGLGANLVNLRVLHKEGVSVQSARLGLVIEVGGEKLFHAMLAG